MNKLFKKETYAILTKKHITLLAWFGSIVFLVVGGVLWYIHTCVSHESIIEILLRDLAITLWIIGFVGLFYELLIRRRFEYEMSDTFWKSIDADVSLLKNRLKDEAVTSIIKNGLEAKLCNKSLAGIFYDGLILPYVDQENFRDKFEYKIWIKDMSETKKVDDIKFMGDSYFTMEEHLDYRKCLT